MYRPCFSLNPISYLLRICDDLQEWERIYFVVSNKSNIVICNKCKTPIIGYREEKAGELVSRYRCNCQFMFKKNTAKQSDNRASDCYIQAFDGSSKFSYRRIYNVSVCDIVSLEGSMESDKKLLFRLHYDPYKLLHVAYQNGTYAKYRISELNSLKRLFECQKGIPAIYLDYFVTSNPIHIKVKILEEYLEYEYARLTKQTEEKGWKKPFRRFIFGIMQEKEAEKIFETADFENWVEEKTRTIGEYIIPVKSRFIEDLKCGRSKKADHYKEKLGRYLDAAIEFYSRLLVYQWLNEYLNNYRNESFTETRETEYGRYKYLLLSSEWMFAKQYFYTPELRCMIEDCFLQFTRMYLDISKCDFFPDEYYKQYENGEREKIFNCNYIDDTGKELVSDIAADKRYFGESEKYYYNALARYLDAELYRPISMVGKDEDMETDIVKGRTIDAYTDLYLFYLMDQEMKKN